MPTYEVYEVVEDPTAPGGVVRRRLVAGDAYAGILTLLPETTLAQLNDLRGLKVGAELRSRVVFVEMPEPPQ